MCVHQALLAKVLQLQLNPKYWTNALIVCDKTQLLATLLVAHGGVTYAQHVTVGLSRLQPHFGQIFLELTMDLHSLVDLSLLQLHEKFGLLRHIQGDVLLDGWSWSLATCLKIRLPLYDFGVKTSRRSVDQEASLLSPENSVSHSIDGLANADGVDVELVIKHPDLSIFKCDQNALNVSCFLNF
jgi:hypothetical protein